MGGIDEKLAKSDYITNPGSSALVSRELGVCPSFGDCRYPRPLC